MLIFLCSNFILLCKKLYFWQECWGLPMFLCSNFILLCKTTKEIVIFFNFTEITPPVLPDGQCWAHALSEEEYVSSFHEMTTS
jgi:hypothetical protein